MQFLPEKLSLVVGDRKDFALQSFQPRNVAR
jgi:hypothetical protein